MSSMRLAHSDYWHTVTIGSLLTPIVDMRRTFSILPCGREHLECLFLSISLPFLSSFPFKFHPPSSLELLGSRIIQTQALQAT